MARSSATWSSVKLGCAAARSTIRSTTSVMRLQESEKVAVLGQQLAQNTGNNALACFSAARAAPPRR